MGHVCCFCLSWSTQLVVLYGTVASRIPVKIKIYLWLVGSGGVLDTREANKDFWRPFGAPAPSQQQQQSDQMNEDTASAHLNSKRIQ